MVAPNTTPDVELSLDERNIISPSRPRTPRTPNNVTPEDSGRTPRPRRPRRQRPRPGTPRSGTSRTGQDLNGRRPGIIRRAAAAVARGAARVIRGREGRNRRR